LRAVAPREEVQTHPLIFVRVFRNLFLHMRHATIYPSVPADEREREKRTRNSIDSRNWDRRTCRRRRIRSGSRPRAYRKDLIGVDGDGVGGQRNLSQQRVPNGEPPLWAQFSVREEQLEYRSTHQPGQRCGIGGMLSGFSSAANRCALHGSLRS
jgi:hypothetical protein